MNAQIGTHFPVDSNWQVNPWQVPLCFILFERKIETLPYLNSALLF